MKNLKSLLLGAVIVGSFVACSDDDNDGGNNGSADSRTELYATSNDNSAPEQGGNIEVFDLSADGSFSSRTLVTLSTSAEGVYYDASDDVVIQASRSDLQLNSYANVEASEDGISLTLTASSSADLNSPRDIAVSADGNVYVVADNGDDSFYIYTRTNGNFELRNVLQAEFDVWGIEFVGSDLYAVVDTTSDVAVYNNFLSNTANGTVVADARVTFEGIVRTHGLAFDGNTMILTDIGAASGAGADTDGAFHVVTNFVSKFNGAGDGGTVALEAQSRVSGALTLLGNPVAAEYDAEADIVYIAERANSGGLVLSFDNATTLSGNVGPSLNAAVRGASSLYFYKE